MCKGNDLCPVEVIREVARLALLCKYDRNAELHRCKARNRDAGCLYGKYLSHAIIRKQPMQLLARLAEQVDIYHMVEKAIDLEYSARINPSVALDSLLHQFHNTSVLPT